MKQIVSVMAQTTAANCRLAGMQALNAERERRGESAAYTEEDFEKIIMEFGLGYNQVWTTLAF